METLLTVEDVMNKLHCSRSTVYRYVSEKRIEYIRRFRRLLFRESVVNHFIDQHTVKANDIHI